MKLNRNKDDARKDFNSLIIKSWTWERLTDEERGRAIDAIMSTKMTGSYDQRWATLNSVYNAFLLGVGYDGPRWREPADSDAPLF